MREMSDAAFGVQITNEMGWPTAQRVIAELYDVIDAVRPIDPDQRQTVIEALADAFSAGSKWTYDEVMAQLIENHLEVHFK